MVHSSDWKSVEILFMSDVATITGMVAVTVVLLALQACTNLWVVDWERERERKLLRVGMVTFPPDQRFVGMSCGFAVEIEWGCRRSRFGRRSVFSGYMMLLVKTGEVS